MATGGGASSLSQSLLVLSPPPPDLDDLLEGVQVLLHAVVEPQVGDEAAGEHPIEPVEQRIRGRMEVDHVDREHMTCRDDSQSEHRT
ncbi:hypothetical protein EYF80_061038 [Liparis tanakae]|uniref:Uncharacterized protein n=1 Tax=Liparis tanakae TaxID=230148 RepID=A0A4Z2EIX9_9TELE|nr:hypothetical protein EYF80_061038 [Liparis tanakae]